MFWCFGGLRCGGRDVLLILSLALGFGEVVLFCFVLWVFVEVVVFCLCYGFWQG